jgi:tetratricopeptide (TPR) repeat protein
MSSIIEGYNYDIFISYRQKDNKGDRWVSEFVEALKNELGSTFKEEISVFIDINPHDGLLETHDVDASLNEKIKCLVFIPVLSRTYCDPKSFAWEHEFKAFIKQASNDQFGLKVKLSDGNVASRILPVKIHELDTDDKVLLEEELGGILRSIDFIYKEPGVNRSLTQNDNEEKNLNRTNYRNQINKVALAIKEIISGMKRELGNLKGEMKGEREYLSGIKDGETKKVQKKTFRLSTLKLLAGGLAFAVLLAIALIFIYPERFKRDKLANLRSSDGRITVAVMPFQNMTNDSLWNVWQEGIQNELINSLTNCEELKIRQIRSITGLIQSQGLTNYASITPAFAGTISRKLDASIFIYGSIKQAGGTVRLNAQLINSKTEDTFKSFHADGTAGNILHLIDSLSWMVKNFLIISKMEKELTPDIKIFASTSSPEAYRYFLDGDKAYWKRDYSAAVKLFSQAAAIDSDFTVSTIMLSVAYGDQGLFDQARKWCLRAYAKRDKLPLQQKIFTNWIHAQYFESPFEKIKYINQLLGLDDQMPILYYQLGLIYNELYMYDKAIPEGERALEIYEKWDVKPKLVDMFTMLGIAYHETKQFKKEKKLYKEAENYFPDNPEIIRRQIILSLSESDTVSANKYIEKYMYVLNDYSASQEYRMTSLASVYYETGLLDKAEKLFREVLSLHPQNPDIMNSIAWIQIDNDRNINEGLELVDRALGIDPENYKFIDTKGWGLFKQKKYKEALEYLEKSWELKPVYNHDIFLHIEKVKKAIASQK